MYSTWIGKKRSGNMTGNKNSVHDRKLCSPCRANFQYTKMKKPALKTVWGVYIEQCTLCVRGSQIVKKTFLLYFKVFLNILRHFPEFKVLESTFWGHFSLR